MKRFSLLILAVLIAMGCADEPSIPAYYSPIEIVPDREAILALPLPENNEWSVAETAVLKSLWIGSLPPDPPSPSNPFADNPQAAQLGHKLFFETRMSANNQVSCASCHLPTMNFSDNVPVSFGTRTTQRNTPTLVGSAYAPWLTWDGHKDSLWSQALEPIEHADEHGSTRLHVVHLMHQDEYRDLYEAVFGPLPEGLEDYGRFPAYGGPVEYNDYQTNWNSMMSTDQEIATQIFVNVGKAIEAYERLLVPGISPFDQYVQALLQGDGEAVANSLQSESIAGLRLFLGEADCIRCHNGPLFSDFEFHNTGVPLSGNTAVIDDGRATGVRLVLLDPFNCLSSYSTASTAECGALSTLQTDDPNMRYAFRTPMLRYVSGTGPFMHQGQLNTLVDVMHHYDDAPSAPLGNTELEHLDLSDEALYEIETFIRSLSASPATPTELLSPPVGE